jgi:hypothetical protein
MNKDHNRKYWLNAFVAITIIIGFLMLALVSPIQADDQSNNPALKYVGKTIGQWSAKWWQWAMSIPLGSTPLLGGDCDQNQRGPVWYLAGNFGGEEERDCTVPRGKSIFFPLVNAMFFNDPPPAGPISIEEKRFILDALFNETEPAIFNSRACELSATLDGDPAVYNFPIVRTQSPPFRIEFIEENIQGVDPGFVDEEVVSDGFWVMLPPLTAGEHEIHFTGGICDLEEGTPFFVVDVVYHITVF